MSWLLLSSSTCIPSTTAHSHVVNGIQVELESNSQLILKGLSIYDPLHINNIHLLSMQVIFVCQYQLVLYICFLFVFPANNCGIPERPAYGWVKFLNGIGVGARAWYFCRAGFQLVGSESRTCQADGQWKPSVPVCKREPF